MSHPRHDDDLRTAFATLRKATAPTASSAAVRRASIDRAGRSATARRPHRWVLRPVVLAVVGASIVGTATAAISTGYPMSALSSHATADAPAARNLGPLLRSLPVMPDRHGATPGTPAAAVGSAGPVRGATITRDGVTVDAAVNDERLCFAPRTDIAPQGQIGCFLLSVANTAPPTIAGRDARRTWLAAVVPDDVTDLAVTTSDGRTDRPPVRSNLAIAVFPAAERIASIAWIAADGSRVTRALRRPPVGADPNGSVLRLDHG